MLKPNRTGFDSLKKNDLRGLSWSWVDTSGTNLLTGSTALIHTFSLPFSARSITITNIFLHSTIYNDVYNKVSPNAKSVTLRISESSGARVKGVTGSPLYIPMSAMGFFDPLEFSWNVPPGVPGLVFQVEALNNEPSVADMELETILFVQGMYYP